MAQQSESMNESYGSRQVSENAVTEGKESGQEDATAGMAGAMLSAVPCEAARADILLPTVTQLPYPAVGSTMTVPATPPASYATPPIIGEAVAAPPPAHPYASCAVVEGVYPSQPQMLYPTSGPMPEQLSGQPGGMQMMYFNPSSVGYDGSSQGFDPRLGYPMVYPYVPLTSKTKKRTKLMKKSVCCC